LKIEDLLLLLRSVLFKSENIIRHFIAYKTNRYLLKISAFSETTAGKSGPSGATIALFIGVRFRVSENRGAKS
jgi:hypothetical protein